MKRGVLAVVVVLASGCGVPADEQARTLGTPPFGLLTTSTTVPPTTVPPEEGFRLTLYWVTADDQVVPGDPIGLPQAPTFQEVLDLLAEGPPVSEDSEPSTSTTSGTTGTTSPPALRTYITDGLNPEGEDSEQQGVGPLVTGVEGGMVDILINDRFRDEAAGNQSRYRLGIAQMVCTITQFPNANAVRLFDSRGQLPLVNLESTVIEVATRQNIGTCDPPQPRPPSTTSTTRAPRRTSSPVEPAGGAPSSVPRPG